MGIRRLGQTIELDLRDTYGSRLEQFDDAFERSAGAADRWPQRDDVIACRFWRLRPGSDKGRPTAWLEHGERTLRDVPADGVENRVAIPHGLSEIDHVVVNDFIGSEAAHIIMIRRARGRDHAGADMLGELNGEARDSARPALNEDRLARLELLRVIDGAQRGKAG